MKRKEKGSCFGDGNRVMSENEIEKAIAFVKFNQEMEGFEVTPEDEEIGRKILKKEITLDEAINDVLIKNGLEKFIKKSKEDK